MMALSGVRSSWLMLARNSPLSRVGPLQLDVLRRQRALAPADLVQHRRAIETHHHLVAQGLEQLEVVLGERPPVAVVVHADGADDDPGGAERHDRRRAEQDVQSRHPVAARVGVHVVGDDGRAAGDHRRRPASRPPGRARPSRARAVRSPLRPAGTALLPPPASTAPLSACSRSAAASAISWSRAPSSLLASSVAATRRSRSSSRLRAAAEASASRRAAFWLRARRSPTYTTPKVMPVASRASRMPSQWPWNA